MQLHKDAICKGRRPCTLQPHLQQHQARGCRHVAHTQGGIDIDSITQLPHSSFLCDDNTTCNVRARTLHEWAEGAVIHVAINVGVKHTKGCFAPEGTQSQSLAQSPQPLQRCLHYSGRACHRQSPRPRLARQTHGLRAQPAARQRHCRCARLHARVHVATNREVDQSAGVRTGSVGQLGGLQVAMQAGGQALRSASRRIAGWHRHTTGGGRLCSAQSQSACLLLSRPTFYTAVGRLTAPGRMCSSGGKDPPCCVASSRARPHCSSANASAAAWPGRRCSCARMTRMHTHTHTHGRSRAGRGVRRCCCWGAWQHWWRLCGTALRMLRT